GDEYFKNYTTLLLNPYYELDNDVLEITRRRQCGLIFRIRQNIPRITGHHCTIHIL
ncbi:hypothetical protein LEA_20375, partial [human gut metagenome]